MAKRHIRLHTANGVWWVEEYLDCKHGWNLTDMTWSSSKALLFWWEASLGITGAGSPGGQIS
jgi:hypothetical protein